MGALLHKNAPTMQLIVITPPGLPGPHEIKQANAMLQRGLKCLHLRKPSWPGAANLASYLDELEPRFRCRVVVHQHHELVDSYQLKARSPSDAGCATLWCHAHG